MRILKTLILPSFVLILIACSSDGTTDSARIAAAHRDSVNTELERISPEVNRQNARADSTGSLIERRIRSGKAEGTIAGYVDEGKLLRLDLHWPESDEHDRYVFNEEGRLIFSTHRKDLHVSTRAEDLTRLELKLLYNSHHEAVNVLSRRGKINDMQPDLSHLSFDVESDPDLEALNDLYVLRLNLALENLGHSAMIR